LLNGAGYLDGSDITETTSLIIQLALRNYQVTFFAVDQTQEEVYDHYSKKLDKNEIRNVIAESCRVTRASVTRLNKTKHTGYDFLIVPGGGGIGITATNYAESGAKFTINTEVSKFLDEFVNAKKPILFTSNANVLAAKLKNGIKVSIGDDQQIVDIAKELGATVESTEVTVDADSKLGTVAGFSNATASALSVYQAIGTALDQIVKIGSKQVGKAKSGDMSLIDNAMIKAWGEKGYAELKKIAAKTL
jgi:enhancing lycopene biosynthesis protein 2